MYISELDVQLFSDRSMETGSLIIRPFRKTLSFPKLNGRTVFWRGFIRKEWEK